jgi:aryl-alcohol dehydrogenase-like predicted oxidoreductase
MGQPEHPSVSRRQFVKTTGTMLSAAAAAWGPNTAPGGENPSRLTVPQVVLGRTGVTVSKLGLGCAHFQRPHIGIEDVRRVLDRALELGVNYLDVAPNYGNEQTGFSETKMGPTIKEIRDQVFLVTKTEEPTYEGTWRLLRQSMKRLQTDHLDLVHVHNFGVEERFPDIKFTLSEQGTMGALREAKREGVVRFIGASGHLFPSRFHAILDTGEIDVLMNAVNFVTQHTYDFEHKVWARARQEGVALVPMKVLGGAGPGAQGFRLPEAQYENAIRYVMSIAGVACVVIGLATVSELQRAAQTVAAFRPLSEQESHDLSRLGLQMAGSAPWKTAYGEPVT